MYERAVNRQNTSMKNTNADIIQQKMSESLSQITKISLWKKNL